jgi:hypothetical protein
MTKKQQQYRVRDSQVLLKIFQVQQRRSWHGIVASHEFCGYLNTRHEWLWLASREAPPDRERHITQSPILIFPVDLGAIEFYVIKRLLKGGICNARFSIDEVLSEIASWRERQYGMSNRQVIVQADNAPPRTARSTLRCIESYMMVRLPHSPYSPDLAPSDFLDSAISKAGSMDRILRLEIMFWSGQLS